MSEVKRYRVPAVRLLENLNHGGFDESHNLKAVVLLSDHESRVADLLARIASLEREKEEARDKALEELPWWRKDSLGWPIETFKGRPVSSFIRLVCQNIRKITG